MGYTIEWGNAEKTILTITISENISVEDIFHGLDHCLEILDGLDYRVDFLFDFRVVSTPSGWLSQFPRIVRHPLDSHQNFGVQVVMTNNPVILSMGRIFARLKGNFATVADKEAAHEIFEKVAASRAKDNAP